MEMNHTISQLPNGNFLLKLVADGQTVQTTEIPKQQAHEIADVIFRDMVPEKFCTRTSVRKVCGEQRCNRQ